MDGLALAMAEPSLTEDGQLKIRTVRRLQKLLQREKKGYLKVLHSRTGVGLTVPEFTTIVQGLVEKGVCCLKEGREGGVIVVFNEQV
jgi:hypothetical protein